MLSDSVVFIKKVNLVCLCHWCFTRKFMNFSEATTGGALTGTPRRIDVDITSIRQRPNFGGFPRYFHVLSRCNFTDWKIHVFSTYFFWPNSAGRKIHVVSTYYFPCNFNGQKMLFVSTYFFWWNFDGQIIHFVSTYFFRRNFDGPKIYLVSTYSFRCNFSIRNRHGVSTYFFA